MAILFGCDDISLDFPTKRVFSHVTLGVSEGDRIGIVGRNGRRQVDAAEPSWPARSEPDSGRVTHRRDLRVGLLGQRDALDNAASVRSAVVGRCARIRMGVLAARARGARWPHRRCPPGTEP